jgi:hypothetical protein
MKNGAIGKPVSATRILVKTGGRAQAPCNKDARISDRAMELLAIYKPDMPHARCSPNRKSNIAKARKAKPLSITPFFCFGKARRPAYGNYLGSSTWPPNTQALGGWPIGISPTPSCPPAAVSYGSNSLRPTPQERLGWVVGPWKANLETTVPPAHDPDWRSMLPRGRG